MVTFYVNTFSRQLRYPVLALDIVLLVSVPKRLLLVPTVAGFRSNPSVGERDLEVPSSSAAIDVRSVD